MPLTGPSKNPTMHYIIMVVYTVRDNCAGAQELPSAADRRPGRHEDLKGGSKMTQGSFLKNIPFAEPQVLADLVDYQEGRVVSRTFAQTKSMSLTLFAFDKGEGLSTHTAAGDAFVQILDGESSITIGEKTVVVKAGKVVAMPANVPHALQAERRFKMLLVVIKAAE